MQRLVKKLPIVLVAVFALGLVNVAGASAAAPEVLLSPGKKFPIKFSWTNTGTSSEVSSTEGHAMSCTSETGEGEITGAKTVAKVRETYKGCKESLVSCQSGAEAGVITTELLKGHLAYINKSTKAVGLQLEGEAAPKEGEEPLWAAYKCPSMFESNQWRGHLIGQLPTTNSEHENQFNKRRAAFEVAYKTSGVGKQEVTQLEGGPLNQYLVANWGPLFKYVPIGIVQNSRFTVAPAGETIEITA